MWEKEGGKMERETKMGKGKDGKRSQGIRESGRENATKGTQKWERRWCKGIGRVKVKA